MSYLLDCDVSLRYGHSRILHQVALQLQPGEMVGLVGRSGSGKSTLALAILGLLRRRGARVDGTIVWEGEAIQDWPESRLRELRGNQIALVLQAAGSALNPNLTLDRQFEEAWRAHAHSSWKSCRAHVINRLEELSLTGVEVLLRRYPGEISIGQAQRILIAMAAMHHPKLLILDEPTSALDTVSRAEVIRLIRNLNRETNVAVLYISHDLSSVAALCQRLAVIHEGKVVEQGLVQTLLEAPEHPATKALVNAARYESLEPNRTV